jgi:hypothetical protein
VKILQYFASNGVELFQVDVVVGHVPRFHSILPFSVGASPLERLNLDSISAELLARHGLRLPFRREVRAPILGIGRR